LTGRSYITSLIGLGFKQKHQVKFLFDMRGFWADERVDGNLWKLNKFYFKWIYNFFKKREKLFLQYADKTVSLTHNGKAEMLKWNISNLSDKKIDVIPCAADYKLFDLVTPEKRNQAKLSLGLKASQFVLSYIGSLGTWYMTDEMLLFFSTLKQAKPDAKFLLLTPDNKDIIMRKAHQFDLNENDFTIKYVQRKDIPKNVHASDFSIFFIKPAYSKKSSSPTKMGELMAMGIPLICNSNVGDVELIMKKSNAGFCLSQLDKTTFEEIIPHLDSWQTYTPKNIRENSKQFYDLENGLNLYFKIYQELVP